MKRALLLFLMLAVAVAAAGAATADSSWTDPPGDAKGAMDITAVTVTNDTAGNITIKVTAGHVADSALIVVMDTDLNGQAFDATGRAFFAVMPVAGVVVPMAYAFDAAKNLTPVTVPSYRAVATPTGVDFFLLKTDVGIDKGFGFWVDTVVPGSHDWGDTAPDGDAVYTYILTTPPPPPPPPKVKPVIGAPVATPAIAGRKMTVTFAVRKSTDGTPMTTGTMTCDPSVAGKALGHQESFKGGTAKLTFTVPKTAKGKQLKVKVTIVSTDGLAATRVAPFKVR